MAAQGPHRVAGGAPAKQLADDVGGPRIGDQAGLALPLRPETTAPVVDCRTKATLLPRKSVATWIAKDAVVAVSVCGTIEGRAALSSGRQA
jgi:hypothetical protein